MAVSVFWSVLVSYFGVMWFVYYFQGRLKLIDHYTKITFVCECVRVWVCVLDGGVADALSAIMSYGAGWKQRGRCLRERLPPHC